MNTSRKLLSGSALRLVTLVVSVLLSFFMMPFIIHTVGDYWYGLWVVAGSILSFYGLMDFGLSSATQRYIAYALAREDKQELNTVFMTSLVLFSGIGAIAFIVTLLITAAAPLFIEIKETLMTFRLLIVIMGTTFALSFPFHVLNGILTANLRYDISSYIQIGKMLLRTGLVIYALKAGHSILGMAVATIIVDIVGHVALSVICVKLAPWIEFKFRYFSKSYVQKLFNFGFYSFLIFLVDKFRLSASSLIIAAFLTVETVTIYNIAVQLSLHYIQVMASILAVLSPVFTRFTSLGDDKRLTETFLLTTRLGIVMASLLAVGIIIFSNDFIRLWLGEEYLGCVLPLKILIMSLLFDVIQGPALSVYYAKAKHKFYAFLYIGELAVNLVLGIILVQFYGIVGIAIGFAVAVFLSKFIVNPIYLSKILKISYYEYFKKTAPPLLIAILLQLPVFFLVEGELNTYFKIFAWGAGIYFPLTVMAFFMCLNKQERSYIIDKLAVGIKR